jgi:hypothetical protein
MKKLFTFMLVALLSIPVVRAQESMFNLGDKVVNIGIGLGSTLYSGSWYKTTIPPISLSFEQAILDDILENGVVGVGAYVGFSSYKWHYVYSTYDYGYKYTNIVIGARGNFHYPLVDKLDTYLGVLLGYNIVTSSEFGTIGVYDYSPNSGRVAIAGYVGARYYFSDSFSAFAELGYGISYLTLGIGIRL